MVNPLARFLQRRIWEDNTVWVTRKQHYYRYTPCVSMCCIAEHNRQVDKGGWTTSDNADTASLFMFQMVRLVRCQGYSIYLNTSSHFPACAVNPKTQYQTSFCQDRWTCVRKRAGGCKKGCKYRCNNHAWGSKFETVNCEDQTSWQMFIQSTCRNPLFVEEKHKLAALSMVEFNAENLSGGSIGFPEPG